VGTLSVKTYKRVFGTNSFGTLQYFPFRKSELELIFDWTVFCERDKAYNWTIAR